MRYDREASWTTADTLPQPDGIQDGDLDQLLAAASHATACSAALVFTLEGGRCVRRAATGSPLAQLVEVTCLVDEPALAPCAFQLSPSAHDTAVWRITVDEKELSCFAAAAAFQRKSGVQGLLVVLDDIAHRQLSPAQTYVLEAQAAHCGTLLELEQLRHADSRYRGADGEQAQRLRLLESGSG